MPTPVIQYVDTDVVGGTGDGSSWANAYSKLSDWEAQNTDLVAADQTLTVKCRASGGTADTTRVLLSGWTTDATHTITITMDPGHSGYWDDTLYRIVGNSVGGGFAATLYISQDWVTVDGLQVEVGDAALVGLGATSILSGDIIVRNNIVRKTAGTQVAHGIGLGSTPDLDEETNVYCYNNIVYGFKDAGIHWGNNYLRIDHWHRGLIVIMHNTVVDCGNYCILGTGSYSYGIVKNNLMVNALQCWLYQNNPNIETAGNYTDDTSGPDGLDNTAVTFLDEGNENYHLHGAMEGLIEGVAVSAVLTTDIDAETRYHWDAGADELPAVSADAPGPYYNTIHVGLPFKSKLSPMRPEVFTR